MRTVLSALALAALTGCSSTSYFLVSSQYVSSTQAQQAPEVITTDAYRSNATSTNTVVAVRAPDSCSNNTADQVSGGAASKGTIMLTNCGVEMAEVERALARSGYRVISWNILARELRGNKSAAEVAGAMGADVLFQINSLERSQKSLGQDARWERKFFKSNPQAQQVSPLPLSDDHRSLIRNAYLADREKQFSDNSRTWAVTLDASAVWVKTGQSIWYYRWTRAADNGANGKQFDVLLACRDGNLGQCQRTFPQRRQDVASTLVAGESSAVSVSERAEDRERAVYAELLREVIESFVTSYAAAAKGNTTAAAAPVR
jgi:hypothetical protein